MPEPERENVDPKQNTSPGEITKKDVKAERVVSWQDGVDGKSLFTVGFMQSLRTFESLRGGICREARDIMCA